MAHILGIDQSTSATKALLYTVAGDLVDEASAEHLQIYPRPGWVEHDAEEIWSNLLQAVGTLIERNRERVSDLLCISLTNQRETFVVFDRRTGLPLRNAIVWQCRRGDEICTELLDTGHASLVRQKTGLRIDTYFSGPKIAWLMRNEPEIASSVRDGEALIGTIDAYLVYRLTNRVDFATDHTNASRTLLYDIRSLAWDEQLCRLFGVPPAALPEVRESFAQFGETDFGGLLPKRVAIRGVMGDSQAALFAHACFAAGTAKVTFGTGSSVLLNIGDGMPAPTPDDDDASGAVTSLAWVHRGQPTYCLEGIINYSAATLAWLRDRLGLIQSFDEVEPLAIAAGDNGGVYLVPAFAGLGAPHWRPAARAAIVGLSAHSGREHVVRAALESIAYQVHDVLEMMRESAGVDLRTIHADGGATKNRFLMQFTADIVGIHLRAADVCGCSPLGAAMAGALGAGIYRSLDDLAALPRMSTTYKPAMPRERATEHLAGWSAAVTSVLLQSSQRPGEAAGNDSEDR
jgi:glycerol kinase